ncbi:MAG: DoxX family protein [Methylobacter sp.]|uniref:DoxX family protein n=1 Tax=Methylobacter sp. TaxID=2051955 RepID=UPI00258F4390|nr:DoxX family protein [Methylobacter sp.]MCL7423410.1 DoxX family protein [Methylobacter sp.]
MNNLLKRTLISEAGLEAIILRVPIGLILAAHGSQKLFAWFGGKGLEGTGQWMASIGLNPGFVMALLAGSAEFFGGIALILGLLTRPAAMISAVTMLVALFWVHWGNGFFLSSHGIEYALALLSATLALTVIGGGRYSLDRYLIGTYTRETNYE